MSSSTDEGVRVPDCRVAPSTGSHVVVTVPLGVLKTQTPTLLTAAPSRADRRWRRALGLRTVREGGPGVRRALLARRGLVAPGPLPARTPDSRPHGSSTWTRSGWARPSPATCSTQRTRYVSTSWPIGAAQWVLDQLAVVLDAPCPPPVGRRASPTGPTTATRRGVHPRSPGGLQRRPRPPRHPVAGRILFAGEHTQSARVGYADGAMTSGIREAKRLLGRPAVRLGPRLA